MKTSVDDIWINMRAYNILKKAGIETLEDLTKPQNWQKILDQKGCGKATIIDIGAAILNAVGGQLLEDAKILEEARFKLKKQQNL